MKKGYCPPVSLGALLGQSDSIRAAESVTKQPGANITALFYASAFQAGINEFYLPAIDAPRPTFSSSFIAEHTKYIPVANLFPYGVIESFFFTIGLGLVKRRCFPPNP